MEYSIHIYRKSDDGSDEETITLDEWNAYLASDPDFVRSEPGHPQYRETLVLLPTDSADPDNWPWLYWLGGSIYADYPQRPMLKKMAQITRHFGAVMEGEDTGFWTFDENDRVRVEPP